VISPISRRADQNFFPTEKSPLRQAFRVALSRSSRKENRALPDARVSEINGKPIRVFAGGAHFWSAVRHSEAVLALDKQF
jgi:hypothetical protein